MPDTDISNDLRLYLMTLALERAVELGRPRADEHECKEWGKLTSIANVMRARLEARGEGE